MHGSNRYGLYEVAQQGVADYEQGNSLWNPYTLTWTDGQMPRMIAMPVAVQNYYTAVRGERKYELSNHLGNVLSVITDRKFAVGTGSGGHIAVIRYTADVVHAADYYPFGMVMHEREFKTAEYRYGFNGKEKDTEWDNGESGNVYDYGFRIYNPAIGKFLSVDPLTRDYPSWSPYPFAMNRVIDGVDLDGLEYENAMNGLVQGVNQAIINKRLSETSKLRAVLPPVVDYVPPVSAPPTPPTPTQQTPVEQQEETQAPTDASFLDVTTKGLSGIGTIVHDDAARRFAYKYDLDQLRKLLNTGEISGEQYSISRYELQQLTKSRLSPLGQAVSEGGTYGKSSEAQLKTMQDYAEGNNIVKQTVTSRKSTNDLATRSLAASRVVLGVAVAMTIHNIATSDNPVNTARKEAQGWMGAAMGAKYGCQLGSAFGPFGALAGGIVGGMAGYMLGYNDLFLPIDDE